MGLQHNTDRIRTTHVGSLPRPHELLDALRARLRGEPYDEYAYSSTLARSVADVVRRQAECGIDFVTDGEFSKPGFFSYIQERLEGFEARPAARRRYFDLEVRAFPEYYAEYFGRAMLGGTLVPIIPVVCVGPIRYRGAPALARDLDNVKTAARAAGIPPERVFMPATAPSGVGGNEYYASEEGYLAALASALGQEYRAIVDAGLLLQIDDPGLSEVFSDPSLDAAGRRRRAGQYVEATNAALAGIPAERVRFHTCYGINEGPRIHEADLEQVIGFALEVNAALVSFEAANPRHEHEYHLFERVRLPQDKVLCPGVITHASNIVEHPEMIAERLLRYAHLVGRESVVAGADCGFSSQATYHTEVHPSVVWAKLQALAEGARRASARLWKSSRRHGADTSLTAKAAMKRTLIGSGSDFEAQIGYSRAVVQGDWVFVSGTTGFDYSSMTISESLPEQAEQCLKNIEAALATAGASLRDVVRVTYVLPKGSDFPECWPVLRRYFGETRPAAMMISAGLADPRMQIEIEVTALKGGEGVRA